VTYDRALLHTHADHGAVLLAARAALALRNRGGTGRGLGHHGVAVAVQVRPRVEGRRARHGQALLAVEPQVDRQGRRREPGGGLLVALEPRAVLVRVKMARVRLAIHGHGGLALRGNAAQVAEEQRGVGP